jgi:hypothetical protein
MGDLWLRWLPDYLAAEGLNVRTWSGWETRSRSSGGFDSLLGLVVHHTVSNTSIENDARFCWENAADRPIGTCLLGRDGTYLVGTAGATNTNGRGGPRLTTAGVIPLDNGNRTCPAIEACNNGVGEPWPTVQQDAYIKGAAGFIRGIRAELGVDIGVNGVFSHSEWAPTRKMDPAGPSRWRPAGGTWSHVDGMDRFRGDVFAHMLPPPEPEPEPEPPDDDLILIGGLMKPRVAKTKEGQFFLCTGVAVQPKTAKEVDYLIEKLGPELRDLVSPRKSLSSHRDVTVAPAGSIAAFGRLVAGTD